MFICPSSNTYREAEEVRLVLPQILDLNNEAHASGLHKLRNIYKKIILADLDYALDKKVEQDLWNVCFKIPVSKLQPDPKDPKSRKNENTPLLGWFLESASGVYLVLLQEICARFSLEVPFCKNNISLGIFQKGLPLKEPKKASCLYITQYCLIHLGDLARYRTRPDEAVGYYKEAIYIEPSSGHPYNQLALLEAAGGDKLLTMYYYCRSLTLKHPFPPAKKNLEKLHKKNTSFNITYKSRNRLSAEEFLVSFFKFQGQIGLCCDLDQAEQIGRLLALTVGPLIATESVSAHQITRMLQINMYNIEEMKGTKELDSLSNDERRCLHLAVELTASVLNACLVSAYSLSGEQLINYGFLPVVKFVLDWLFVNPNLLFHPAVFKRQSLWSAATKLFNELQLALGHGNSGEDQDTSPLPEDADFARFSPLRQLADSYRLLRQTTDADAGSSEKIGRLRALRILERAKWLSQQELNSVHCITAIVKAESSGPTPHYIFESLKVEDNQTTNLENQLEALSTDSSTAGAQKKGILKEVKILTRKPRNVALAAIMKQNAEESVVPPISTNSEVGNSGQPDNSRQVKFQMPIDKVTSSAPALLPTPPLLPLPPPPLLPTPTVNTNAYPRPSLPPRLERLRTEQKDRDILNHLGLYSGFGTSLTSNVTSASPADAPVQLNNWPNVSVPPPPPPVQFPPPPGLGFRPQRENHVPPPWPNFSSLQQMGAGPGNSGYSLFNSQTWSPGQIPTGFQNLTSETRNSFEHLPYNRPPFGAPPVVSTAPSAASLWSGPGPSPLERLLEQQKALRGSSPAKTSYNNPHHHKMNNGL